MSNIKEIIDSLDGEELCRYCVYSTDCSKGVTGGPNGPIYPPCASGGLTEDDFDMDLYLQDMEKLNET